MNARRPPGRTEPGSASSALTAGRGIVLVVVAAALGLLLLGKALDGPSSAEVQSAGPQASGSDTTVPEGGTTTAAVTAAPTTAPASINPQVKVIVANGSGTAGVAGKYTDQLNAQGALLGTPTNSLQRVDGSTVYYVNPDAEPTARAVSAIISNPTVTVPVAALPSTDIIENADIQDAGVVVVIGRDLGAAS